MAAVTTMAAGRICERGRGRQMQRGKSRLRCVDARRAEVGSALLSLPAGADIGVALLKFLPPFPSSSSSSSSSSASPLLIMEVAADTFGDRKALEVWSFLERHWARFEQEEGGGGGGEMADAARYAILLCGKLGLASRAENISRRLIWGEGGGRGGKKGCLGAVGFAGMAAAYAWHGDLPRLRRLHLAAKMEDPPLLSSSSSTSTCSFLLTSELVLGFVRCGAVEEAAEVMEEMEEMEEEKEEDRRRKEELWKKAVIAATAALPWEREEDGEEEESEEEEEEEEEEEGGSRRSKKQRYGVYGRGMVRLLRVGERRGWKGMSRNTWEKVIGALAQGGEVQALLEALQKLSKYGVEEEEEGDGWVGEEVIKCFGRAGMWEEAVEYFVMSSRKRKTRMIKTSLCNTLLLALFEANKMRQGKQDGEGLEDVLSLFESFIDQGFVPNSKSYEIVFKSLASSRRWAEALALYRGMCLEDPPLVLTSLATETLCTLFLECSRWQHVEELLEREEGSIDDAACSRRLYYEYLFRLFEKKKRRRALTLYHSKLLPRHYYPSDEDIVKFFRLFGERNEWGEALSLFSDAVRGGKKRPGAKLVMLVERIAEKGGAEAFVIEGVRSLGEGG